MRRTRIYRYKVLSGPMKGLVGDGIQIGVQDYPNQYEIEQLTTDQIKLLWEDKHNKGLGEGIWINEAKQPFYPSIRRKIQIDEEGVSYDDVYMDLCVPFDRFNKEIFVGDTIYISSKNEVIPCVLEKIAKKPFMASYGIMNRKLTVRPVEGGAAKTINDPRSTVKA
jgi:hypothetical protein